MATNEPAAPTPAAQAAPTPTARAPLTPTSDKAPAVVSIPAVEKDPEIEALNLSETASKAAYALKKAHPTVKFTSGRRGKDDQARAMASNVVSNRKWIEQTYKENQVRTKCQEWVDANPTKKTQAEIQEGLVSVFNNFTDDELGAFSKHLSGNAFDVQPVDKDAEAIKTTIRGLSGLKLFLESEGGLVRWHAQF